MSKTLILTTDEYLDSCNSNFCGGVLYACEQLEEVLSSVKQPNKKLVKAIEDMKKEAIKLKMEIQNGRRNQTSN